MLTSEISSINKNKNLLINEQVYDMYCDLIESIGYLIRNVQILRFPSTISMYIKALYWQIIWTVAMSVAIQK